MRAARIRARLDTCPRCDAAIIVGLDCHIAALAVRADPVPLDATAELHARMAGRLTYDLVGRPEVGQQLSERTQDTIHARTWPVVATHTCPGPVPATAIPAPPQQRPAEPDLFTPEDTPPF